MNGQDVASFVGALLVLAGILWLCYGLLRVFRVLVRWIIHAARGRSQTVPPSPEYPDDPPPRRRLAGPAAQQDAAEPAEWTERQIITAMIAGGLAAFIFVWAAFVFWGGWRWTAGFGYSVGVAGAVGWITIKLMDWSWNDGEVWRKPPDDATALQRVAHRLFARSWRRVFHKELGKWPEVYQVGYKLEFDIVAKMKRPRPDTYDSTAAKLVFMAVWGVTIWQMGGPGIAVGAVLGLIPALLVYVFLRRRASTELTMKISPDDGGAWKDPKGRRQAVPWEYLRDAQPDIEEQHQRTIKEAAVMQRHRGKNPPPMPVYAFASQLVLWTGPRNRDRRVVAEIADDISKEKARLLGTAILHVLETMKDELERDKARAAGRGRGLDD